MGQLGTVRDVTSPIARKKLQVLKPGETRRDKVWKECIFSAKLLIKQGLDIKVKVVELAEKCCIVHHGGSVDKSKNRYTLRRFAKETGVKWGTFYEWYTIKNHIINNLSKEQIDDLSFSEMRRIKKSIPASEFHKKTAKKVLNNKIKELRKKTDTTIKMEHYLKHLKTIHFNVSNKLMIKDCDTEVLGKICHLSRSIVRHLAKYDKKTK